MKTAHHGAGATGMRVMDHTVDDVARHPQIAARQGGVAALCATCRACPVVRTCGGGLYAHRYGPNGFDNPSVYCADLKELIKQVIAEDVAVTARDTPPSAGIVPAPRPAHQLPTGGFGAFAAGPGDVATMRELSGAWLSRARALVAAVAASDDGWRDGHLRAAMAAGWELLCSLDERNSQAVRHVLSYPGVAAWAVRCLRPASRADLDLDRAHLAGIAMAAAARARVSAELPVPVHEGWAHLPGVGAMAAPPGTGRVTVLRTRGGRVVADESRLWRPARHLDAGALSGTVVEDLDPFRDCYDLPVAPPLPAPQWHAWRRGLVSAGSILADAVPSYLEVVIEGLRSIVPLSAEPGAERAATARQAFGSVAIALPAKDAILAELLLHEFQHVKLNGLTDLHPMIAPGARPMLLGVPWRPDPRPVLGALHGAYAFLAMMDLRRVIGPRQRYLRYRSWVLAVTESLLATKALTADGERFVAGIAAAASADAGASAGCRCSS
jgi:uncharacterized protein